MSTAVLKRSTAWLPTIFVLLVVLLSGSRLIMLSLERHAEDARAAARAALNRERIALESQFTALTTRAVREATRTNDLLARGARTVISGRDTFLIDPNGSVHAVNADLAVVNAIASEWASVDAKPGGADARFAGPTRQGSQWFVATRAPVLDAKSDEAGRTWAVAYADLERLLANAKLGRLVAAGYDFTLLQTEPGSPRTRPLISSGPATLEDPMTAPIRTPISLEQGASGRSLVLAIRPRDGWYPGTRLASEIGLLALIAWLVAFATHDLIQHVQHLKTQLADSQQQQAALGEQLLMQMQERQDLQKNFDHARYHDAFTGLPNRRFFMDQLDRALREVRSRRRQGIAVALIDIDRFKLINETLGHAAGDELMVQVAQRFEHAGLGMENVLARWEGDQFALLLLDVPSRDAALNASRLLEQCLRERFELRRHRLSITASVGITTADSGLQRPEDLLREADIALAVAKRTEDVTTVAYQPAMGGHAASLVSLEADLHLAIERNELRLLYQPVVDLRTKQTVGAEALLRWQHPVEGLLTPDRFLSIAEESGLMLPITRWVIGRVCKLAAEWRQRLEPGQPFYVSINLSAASLRDRHLSTFLASTLLRTQAPASALKFEISEAGLINNVGEARDQLRRLHDMGIEVMLDDFGTGYSSLNHLELFPFDFVKIDRPFVSRVGTDSANSGIMAAVVQIASSLDIKAIAEVIETQAAAQALQEMGCDYGQGYFFGAPAEAEETLQRLRGRQWSSPPPDTSTREGPSDDDSSTLVLPVIHG